MPGRSPPAPGMYGSMGIGYIPVAITIGERVIGRAEEANIGKPEIGNITGMDGIGEGVTGVEIIAHEKANCRKVYLISGSFPSPGF